MPNARVRTGVLHDVSSAPLPQVRRPRLRELRGRQVHGASGREDRARRDLPESAVGRPRALAAGVRLQEVPHPREAADPGPARAAGPQLFTTTASNWLSKHTLQDEVFGPMAILVVAKNLDEMRDVARALQGQLTCTLHLDGDDTEDALTLVPILERKAGRLLANGFPTGVEVCDSMVHSGPYPASTNFGATSVGTMAIRRFLRPVCYQNIPNDLFP